MEGDERGEQRIQSGFLWLVAVEGQIYSDHFFYNTYRKAVANVKHIIGRLFDQKCINLILSNYEWECFLIMSKNKKYPFVLAHGIARPDHLIDSIFSSLNLSLYDFSFVSDRFHYFKGIASFLRKHEIEVYHSRVSFAADVDTRAEDLKKEINRILEKAGHKKVHIIAHSMGGLDARHMIVEGKMADKIASLTTISTPHHGTSAADWALSQGIDKVIGAIRRFLNLEGIKSVTPESCQKFNQQAKEYEAANDVFYQTYASSKQRDSVFLLFQRSWDVIKENEGANDGLVSVKSANWVEQLRANGHSKTIKQNRFPIQADHLDQIGWWNLNELHKAGWWNLKALREKNEHEEIVKNVYLKIVEEIYDIF